jgi:hypothetical protein
MDTIKSYNGMPTYPATLAAAGFETKHHKSMDVSCGLELDSLLSAAAASAASAAAAHLTLCSAYKNASDKDADRQTRRRSVAEKKSRPRSPSIFPTFQIAISLRLFFLFEYISAPSIFAAQIQIHVRRQKRFRTMRLWGKSG